MFIYGFHHAIQSLLLYTTSLQDELREERNKIPFENEIKMSSDLNECIFLNFRLDYVLMKSIYDALLSFKGRFTFFSFFLFFVFCYDIILIVVIYRTETLSNYKLQFTSHSIVSSYHSSKASRVFVGKER